MSEELLIYMYEALQFAQKNVGKLHESIERVILKVLKEEATKNGTNSDEPLLSYEDTKQSVEFIVKSMKNHIHKLNGQTHRYQFSPYMICFAMINTYKMGHQSMIK